MSRWSVAGMQASCGLRRTCSFPHIHLQGVRLLDIGAEVASTIEQYTVGVLQERQLRSIGAMLFEKVFGVLQTLEIGYMVPMFFAGTYEQYTGMMWFFPRLRRLEMDRGYIRPGDLR